METGNQTASVSQREVVAGIKVIESEYRVQRPVFEDVIVERPVYVNKQIELPVGAENLATELAAIISAKVVTQVMQELDKRLGEAINKRIKEIEVPTIRYVETEKLIDKPVYHDVAVDRPVYKDREVINPVLVNKEVINPVLRDVEVTNAIIKDKVCINPIFEDVVIQKPKWVDKEVTAIHIKYVDPKGNPE